MYFYKEVNENGKLVLLLTYGQKPNIKNPLVIEIAKEEYERLFAEITAEDEPVQDEEQDISAEEALDIILGGEV